MTAGGIEGNFTFGNRVAGTGWLEYAKGVCLGKSVVDVLPMLASGRGGTGGGGGARGGGGGARGGAGGARGGGARGAGRGGAGGAGGAGGGGGGGGGAAIATMRGANGFVGGFGYPNGMILGSPRGDQLPCRPHRCLPLGHPGKAVNRPIYKLLGGTKDRMLAYGSSLHLPALEDFAPQALEAQGGRLPGLQDSPGRRAARDAAAGPIPAYVGHIEEIRSVRKAVGEEFTLLFDPVSSATTSRGAEGRARP